jgi:gliding motility-associated-like protein
VWYIGNIDQYPACEVTIFNIYDTQLYRASPYNNDWDGTFDGKKLPDGTYYYILRCPDMKKEIKGFITLLRNAP